MRILGPSLVCLLLTLLPLSACQTETDLSGSAIEDSAEEGVAGRPIDDEEIGLIEVLAERADSERLAYELVEEDCDKSARCLAELERLKTYIEFDCVDCAPAMQNFLAELTPAQRQGLMPSTYPKAAELLDEAAQALGQDARGPAPGDFGAGPVRGRSRTELDGLLEDLVEDLRKIPRERFDWVQVLDLLPPGEADVRQKLRERLEAGMAELAAAGDRSARMLLDGRSVLAQDAANAVEAAWASSKQPEAKQGEDLEQLFDAWIDDLRGARGQSIGLDAALGALQAEPEARRDFEARLRRGLSELADVQPAAAALLAGKEVDTLEGMEALEKAWRAGG